MRSSRHALLIGGMLVALSLSLFPVQLHAQALPPGVTFELVKEYPASMMAGAKSINQFLYTLAPGAKHENITIEGTNFCRALAGEIRAVDKDGHTMKVRAGDVWVEPKGMTMSIYNDGKVTFVDSFIEVK